MLIVLFTILTELNTMSETWLNLLSLRLSLLRKTLLVWMELALNDVLQVLLFLSQRNSHHSEFTHTDESKST